MAALFSHPLFPFCCALMIISVAGVALFLILSSELAVLRRKMKAERKEVERQLAYAAQALATAREDMTNRPSRLEEASSPESLSNVNVNRRSVVMRRLRAGESAQQVAASLQMSVSEVRLIHRIQKVVVAAY